MTTKITTTSIADLRLGDYLMSYDEEGDGESGTHDDWTADTETDEDGCYLVARHDETGRVVTDAAHVV